MKKILYFCICKISNLCPHMLSEQNKFAAALCSLVPRAAPLLREDADSIWRANKTYLTAALHLQPPTASTDQFLWQARPLRLPIHTVSKYSLFQAQSSEQFPGNEPRLVLGVIIYDTSTRLNSWLLRGLWKLLYSICLIPAFFRFLTKLLMLPRKI